MGDRVRSIEQSGFRIPRVAWRERGCLGLGILINEMSTGSLVSYFHPTAHAQSTISSKYRLMINKQAKFSHPSKLRSCGNPPTIINLFCCVTSESLFFVLRQEARGRGGISGLNCEAIFALLAVQPWELLFSEVNEWRASLSRAYSFSGKQIQTYFEPNMSSK